MKHDEKTHFHLDRRHLRGNPGGSAIAAVRQTARTVRNSFREQWRTRCFPSERSFAESSRGFLFPEKPLPPSTESSPGRTRPNFSDVSRWNERGRWDGLGKHAQKSNNKNQPRDFQYYEHFEGYKNCLRYFFLLQTVKKWVCAPTYIYMQNENIYALYT